MYICVNLWLFLRYNHTDFTALYTSGIGFICIDMHSQIQVFAGPDDNIIECHFHRTAGFDADFLSRGQAPFFSLLRRHMNVTLCPDSTLGQIQNTIGPDQNDRSRFCDITRKPVRQPLSRVFYTGLCPACP